MNELLHKFKLGYDAELLLEKRGGGFEKVATVPIGSQALGVTQSAQGVEAEPVLTAPGIAIKPSRPVGRPRGVVLYGPDAGYNPAPSAVVGQSGVTVTSSGLVTVDGEQWFEVQATNASGSTSSFEIRWTGMMPYSADSATIEFSVDNPQSCPSGVSLFMARASYSAYALAGKSWSLIKTTVATDIHLGRMSIAIKAGDWTKAGYTGSTINEVWSDAKLNIGLVAGASIVFRLRSVRLGVSRKKGRIAIVDDDGYANFFRIGVPILQKYGLKSSAAMIPAIWGNNAGSTSEVAKLPTFQEYVRQGNQCIAHGPQKSPWTNMFSAPYPTTQSRIDEMLSVIKILVDNDLTDYWGAKCYIFPQGVYNSGAGEVDLLEAMLANGIYMARGAQVDNNILASRPLFLDGLSIRNHKRLIMPIIGHQFAGGTAGTAAAADDAAETANVNKIITAIQDLAAAGSDMTLMLHRVVAPGTITTGPSSVDIETHRLDAICAAIKVEIDAGRLDDVLFSDFVRTAF